MAPIKCLRILSYTSQDPLHKAENIINPQNLKKWLCAKTEVGSDMEVEMALESSSKIEHINIGNHGGSFIEILVGKSLWPKERQFEVLLPSVSLMTAAESKDWKNISKVFMFGLANFRGHIATQKWDRIRIKCRQPFAKDKQFGLGFVEFRAQDEKNKGIDLQSSGNPEYELSRGSNNLKNMVNKAIHSSGGSESSSGRILSRTARVLQTALSKSKNGIKSPTNSRPSASLRSPQHSPHDLARNTDVDKGRSPHTNYKNQNFLSGLREEAAKHRPTSANLSSKNKRTPNGNVVSSKFHLEVEAFLKELNLDEMKLEEIQVSDIRRSMESMRGSMLNKAEKQVFFKLLGEALTTNTSFVKGENLLDTPVKKASNGEVSPHRMNVKYNIGNNIGRDRDQSKVSINSHIETPCLNQTTTTISKTPLKRRNVISCRNVLCYDDDIEGPPRKMAAPALKFSPEKDISDKSEDENLKRECPICGDRFSQVILEIHASFCQGKIDLNYDSQPIDDTNDDDDLITLNHLSDSSDSDLEFSASPFKIPEKGDKKHYEGQKYCNDGKILTEKHELKVSSPLSFTAHKKSSSLSSNNTCQSPLVKPPFKLNSKPKDTTSSISLIDADSTSQRSAHSGSSACNAVSLDSSSVNPTIKPVSSADTSKCYSKAYTDIYRVGTTLPSTAKETVGVSNSDIQITKTTPGAVEKVACPICMEMFPPQSVNYHANICADFEEKKSYLY